MRIKIEEERLLVLSACFELSLENRDEMRAILQGGLDWTKVMSDGARLGMTPLLYRHLSKEENCRYVPSDVMVALKKGYLLQTTINMRIYGAIRKILKALNENNIPVILLKGSFLSTHLYPDMALRPMCDIDILCRPEDSRRVRNLISGLEFCGQSAIPYQSALHEHVMAPRQHHQQALSDSVIRVEIHSHIFTKGAFASESVWKKSRECAIGEVGFRCLCPEHQLLHLCAHLYAHMNKGSVVLYWFCDIHETIRRHGQAIDWNGMFDTAKELGIAKSVQSVLLLMKHHWQSSISIPDDNGLMPDLFELLIGRRAKRMAIHGYCQNIAMAKEIKSWQKRFLFLWGFLFPSKAHMSTRYKPRNSLDLVLLYVRHPLIRVKRVIESMVYNLFYLLKKVFQ